MDDVTPFILGVFTLSSNEHETSESKRGINVIRPSQNSPHIVMKREGDC